MARVKTVWTVVGPVLDPGSGQLVEVTVMQGSVTGDRRVVADTSLRQDIRNFLAANGTRLRDYTLTVTTEADTYEYYKMVPEDGGA